MGEREKLRQRFNDAFAQWDIELPMHALSPGEISVFQSRDEPEGGCFSMDLFTAFPGVTQKR